MRTTIAFLLAALPHVGLAQEAPKISDLPRVEVTGCVKGSILRETTHRVAGTKEESNVTSRRWRLRGPKDLMKKIKDHAGQELQIVGTSKDPQSGLVISDRRIGNTRVMIGAVPGAARPDPLPEQPTIDVESFKPTGEKCS